MSIVVGKQASNFKDDSGKWVAVSKTMESWIETGRWRSGQRIPGCGELCANLAVSAPTLRKSLGRLSEGGLIEPVSGGWRVVSHRRTITTAAIALLRRCGPEGQTLGEADREAFFRRTLELDGARRGLRIESWGISDDGRLFRQTRPWSGKPSEVIHGVVLSMWGMDDPSSAFQAVRAMALPVAVWEAGPHPGKHPLLDRSRWFQSAHSPAAGQLAARHLIELGHRAIAWISPFHGSAWSQRRLEGIEQVAASSLKDVAIASFVRTDRWDPSQYTPPHGQVRALLDDFASLAPDALHRRLDEFVEKGQTLLRERQILESLQDLLESALADRRLTAWVCANDDIALLAWSWLSTRGIEIGRDLSLVGFDNSLRAQERGLSSVDFLEDELASGMLNFLLDPGRWRSNRTTHLQGSLVARSSSTSWKPRS